MPTAWLQERPNGSKNDPGKPPRRAFCGNLFMRVEQLFEPSLSRLADNEEETRVSRGRFRVEEYAPLLLFFTLVQVLEGP
jgi:hypothetical protein